MSGPCYDGRRETGPGRVVSARTERRGGVWLHPERAGADLSPAHRRRGRGRGPGQYRGRHRGLQRRDHAEGRLDGGLLEAWRRPTAGGERSPRRFGTCGGRPKSTPRPPAPSKSWATPTWPTRRTATARAAERFEAYVKLDTRAPRVLYKLAFARYNDGHVPDAIDALQRAIALDDRFAEAYYLLGLCQRDAQHPDLARLALEKSIELQTGLLHAREELADLYGVMGRTDDRLRQLEALGRLDPGASTGNRPGPGLRPRRAAGSRRHHARARHRALSRLPLRLRRARPRLARDRAGAQRSNRAEQGDRSARGGGRQRRQQRGAHALRPRAAADLRRRDRRAHAAGRDPEACRSSRSPSTTWRTPRNGSATTTPPVTRSSTTRSSAATNPTSAAEAPLPRVSATCR